MEAEGQNKEAGHSGSNFGVVYGYVDAYNQAWMAKPEFYFNVPRKLVGLWICNTSYTYGVIDVYKRQDAELLPAYADRKFYETYIAELSARIARLGACLLYPSRCV